MPRPVEPKWRTGAGIALILMVIIAWGVAVMLLAPFIGELPLFVQLLLYVVIGIGWIFPVRPLLGWMAKDG